MRQLRVLPAALAAIVLAGSSLVSGWVATPALSASDSVTFDVKRAIDPLPLRTFQAELRCGDQTAARATLISPSRPASTRDHRAQGKTCVIRHLANPIHGRIDEVTFTVKQAGRVLARRTLYSYDGRAQSTPFVVPAGNVSVDIEAESMPAKEVGTPLRIMSFNIWIGGKLGRLAGDEAGEKNLTQLIEYVRKVDPDILFMVETYGSGDQVVEGLNANRPEDDRYTAVRITTPVDNGSNGDNLWLFTKLPVEKVYPRIADGDLTSFNFGGARLTLPDGKHIHAFSAWIWHANSATGAANQSALENVLGLSRTYTDAQILATDDFRRTGQATALLQKRLGEYVDDDAPVLIGGDLNTLSHRDWSAEFANAPGHAGLTLEFPVLKMFADAGFVDTYRLANPDAGTYPGKTWSPYAGFGYAPQRIDYMLYRGSDVRVLGSHTNTERLPEHRDPAIDGIFPFYSDHGALISEILVRGKGIGPGTSKQPELDKPEDRAAGWPAPPAGTPILPAELTATASSANSNGPASNAVDGDLRTHWHSQYSPTVTPLPHDITIDMQKTRTLSAVRYQPRIAGNANGTILRAVVQASDDGRTFRDVTTVEWDRTSWPKDVDLGGLSARYLRFHVELGIGGFSSASEITPYLTR